MVNWHVAWSFPCDMHLIFFLIAYILVDLLIVVDHFVLEIILSRRSKMRVMTLDKNGIKPAKPVKAVYLDRGEYYRFENGKKGIGNKLVYIPLSLKDFSPKIELNEYQEYKLVKVSNGDAYVLVKGEVDSEFLLLWHLSPGFRGEAVYEIEGDAKVLMEGYEINGNIGHTGNSPCPIVHVYGPCKLTWVRSGILNGDYSKYRAVYNGSDWFVEPDDNLLDAVNAAFNMWYK
jgi:hypothetical protein